MGDRSNILVKSGSEQVCLYTHWAGSELHKTLKSALIRGEDRWNDFQYLTRIIFCEMVKGHALELTGYGITQQIHDGDRNIIVNVDDQTVSTSEMTLIKFSSYIKTDRIEP